MTSWMSRRRPRGVRSLGPLAALALIPSLLQCGTERDFGNRGADAGKGAGAGVSGRGGSASGGSASGARGGSAGSGGSAAVESGGTGAGAAASGGSGNGAGRGGSGMGGSSEAGEGPGGTPSAGGASGDGGTSGAGDGGDDGGSSGSSGSGGAPPDPCSGNPCRNGGTCVPAETTFTCECTAAYLGNTCDLLHFEWLEVDRSGARGMSSDGKVIVGDIPGVSRNLPGRWTRSTGWTALESLTLPIDQGYARGANADGSVIVGQANLPSNAGGAFRWTAAEGVVSLGLGPVSVAVGVSANGSTIVGTKYGPDQVLGPKTFVFRWTAAGAVDVQDLGTNGTVTGVNAAGTAVCGSYTPSGETSSFPFLWTQTPGLVRLGTAPGGAEAISSNGNTIVGGVNSPSTQAFVYRTNGGFASVPLEGVTNTRAHAVSGDGALIAGSSSEGPWLWDASNGTRMLSDLLEGFGVDLSVWTSFTIDVISGDGKVLAGDAYKSGVYTSWIVRL